MEIQRLNSELETQYDCAQKYYQILSVLNNLSLAEAETQLIAFAAIHGNITDSDLRQKFCDRYKTTIATINNMVYRLKKKNIFHKNGKIIFVNPMLTKIEFDKPFALLISLSLVEQKQE